MRRVLLLTAAFAFLAAAAPASAAAAPPTGVTAIALNGRVELAWQPVPGATSYAVYRGTAQTDITTPITLNGLIGTSFTDTATNNGTTYYYAVRATVSGVESANSLPVAATPSARSCSTGNAVVVENCFPGTSNWTVGAPATFAAGGIEGFATANSIGSGGSVSVKVKTGASFRIEVYRSGYYGGSGARLVSTILGVPATSQPACTSDTSTGRYDCSNWSVSATLTTTGSWPSGVYLLRLVRDDNGSDTQIPFVVREDARTSKLLYGVDFTTYEAYNNYGGKSLYAYNSTGANTVSGNSRAVKVSFDRPYVQPYDNSIPNWYPRSDYPMVYWLERAGYDVTYQSDTDLERNGGLVQNHRAYMSAAHDEYFSTAMRAALQQARDANPPVNLFFSGANAVYWRIRFENGPGGGQDRIEVCYKTTQGGAADPVAPTTTWRDPAGANQPENALIGQQYVGDKDGTYFPLVVSASEGADRVYRFTGLDAQAPGTSTRIGRALVGWEWDRRTNNGFEPPGVKTLATSPVSGNIVSDDGGSYTTGSTASNVTKYNAPSGALVVATGTNYWARGLALDGDGGGEPDGRIQQTTTNVLADMGVDPQTPAADITLDSPSAPRVASTVPADGANQVSTAAKVTATFSRPMDGTTITSSSFTLKRPDGSLVPASVSYSASTTAATLVPNAALDNSTTYTARLETSVKATDGAALQTAVTWIFTTAAVAQPVRINAGGGAYTASDGRAFLADAYYTGGALYASARTITGTSDQALYKNERWGQFGYAIPVTNGTYDVAFHFVELYYGTAAPGCAGKRIFSMDILDTPTNPDIANLDICALVGSNAALVRTVSGVTVSDGFLNIQSVYGSADDPEVAAIEVTPASSPPPPPPPPPPAAPTVTATTPADGATNVATSVKPSATFSRAMDATTITSSTFTLKKADGTSVPATVAYDSTATAATLTPSSVLDSATTYVARVDASTKAADGTAMGTAVTWSFKTAGCPCTVFAPTLRPALEHLSTANGRSGGPWSLELGLKFKVDTPTRLSAIRFYKDSQETGAHAGTVWTSDGIALASVPFSGETASGWQQQALPTPLLLQPGTVYVISVNANSYFVQTFDALTNEIVSGPIHSVADGQNGVFADAAGDFPVNSYRSSNYFVDLEATGNGSPAAPALTSTVPANKASGVVTTTSVRASFSRALDPATVNSSNFTLTGPNGPVGAAVSYESASNTAVLSPSTRLLPSTTYTARLSTNVTAGDGTPLPAAVQWAFNTRSGPQVTSVVPADGATAVGAGVQPKAVFSTSMDAATITASTFTLTGPGGSVSGSVAYADATHTASFTPAAPLQADTTFTVRLEGSIASAAGDPLGTAYTWTFKTAAPAAPPTVIAKSPADGAVAVPPTTTVTATFSQAMDPNSLTSSTFYLTAPGGPVVPSTISYDAVSSKATLTPSLPLNNGTTYTAHVEGSVQDVNAVALGSAVTWSFSTPACPCSLFPSLLKPADQHLSTANGRSGGPWSLELGIKVKVDTASTLTAIRFYKDSQETGSHVGRVWTADGAPLANVAFATETASGWQQQALPSPLSLQPGLVYVISVNANSFFGTTLSGLNREIVGGPVRSVADGTNGVFADAAGSFPTQSYNSSNYFVDLETVLAGAAAPFALVSVAPANAATGVPVGGTVAATFNRALDASSLSSSSFTLRRPDGSAVPASLSYDSVSKTATLTPSAALAGSTTYTARLETTITSADGAALPNPVSWTFTTTAAAVPPNVTSKSPADGATEISPALGACKVTATFSRAMDPASFTSSSFLLTRSTGAQVPASLSYDAGTSTATLSPSVPLDYSAAYTARLTTAIKAADGAPLQAAVTWSFTTTGKGIAVRINVGGGAYTATAGDSFLADLYGTGGATESFPTRTITATSDPALYRDDRFGLWSYEIPVPNGTYDAKLDFVELVYTAVGKRVFSVDDLDTGVSPDISNLDIYQLVTANKALVKTISAVGVADNGLSLKAVANVGDPEIAAIEVVPRPPTVATKAPVGVNVPRSTTVTATFSRSLDPASVTTASFTLTGPSGAVPATVTYNATTKVATLKPNAALAASSTYTARVDAAVRGADGMTMGAPVTWVFTTGP